MSDEQFLVILIMHVLTILAIAINHQDARPQVISIDKDSGDVTFTVRKPQ